MSWLSDSSILSGLDFCIQKAPPLDCICIGVFISSCIQKAPPSDCICIGVFISFCIQKAPPSDCICIGVPIFIRICIQKACWFALLIVTS